jgi:DNA-binding HxlR family transcriptional regulator
VRAATRALSIFTSVLNARVLRAFADGPLNPGELEEKLGWAPQSSLRAAVANLSECGALVRVAGGHGAPSELTPAGRELLPVAAALEHWLQGNPSGPIPLEDPAAQGIVRVLNAAWDSTAVRALAERPQTLIELSARIPDVNYPALKRRLAKLRSTQLVVPVETPDGAAYAVSDWLRRAVVPLTLAGRWEREHDAGGQPISAVEIEAAFLLALPMAVLPARSTGACALAVLTSEERTGPKREVAGVALEVKQGAIVSCTTGAASNQPTWALGTVNAWLEALVDGRSDALRVSGAKPRLATGIIKAIHTALFSA